jgi:hypothetical protein
MEAKKISQRAVKNMINSNTTLLHIGNFETGKRTNLKRAVNECVYASRLYYNTELQSNSEKIQYLSVYDTDRLFNVRRYEIYIAAINEYTEYRINFDETSKYYTLVISGMRFLIVSDLGWCNIWQVFNTDTPVTTDCKQETETIMERYDYFAAVKEDVLNYINENNIVVTSENRDEVEQDLNDTLFTCDSVTGNASGSYTFSAWTAEEYLCHNWDLLGEALTELGCDMSYIERGAEACDVTIRCYLLGQAISEVLDEVETEEEEL